MKKNGFILLVEDNPDDIALTLDAFQQSFVANHVHVVRDGAAALEYLFGAGAVTPTVVLLDLKLPKVDGLEVLRRIRTDPTTKLLPVVMLTSSKEQADVAASYDLGANSYIRKPVDFDEFVGAVKQLGLYWLLLNEPPPTNPKA